MGMPYRVIATDGLHLTVLLRLAEEYDVHAKIVDANSYEICYLPYWLYVALEYHKAVLNPTYIYGTHVAHTRCQQRLPRDRERENLIVLQLRANSETLWRLQRDMGPSEWNGSKLWTAQIVLDESIPCGEVDLSPDALLPRHARWPDREVMGY